jgi:hypothetical protein
LSEKETSAHKYPVQHFILISSAEDLEALKSIGFIQVPYHYYNGHINVSKPLWKREQCKQQAKE